MANEYEIFEFLEDDARTSRPRKILQLNLRKESDPFDLVNTQFIKRYRLNKELVRHLCHELEPLMNSPKRQTDLSLKTKVLIALSFYVTGSYQRKIGNSDGHFVAQQTASDAIRQVTRCLNHTSLRHKYIHFPVNQQDRNKIKSHGYADLFSEIKSEFLFGFYNKFGIPGVLGCIDCTQVAIIRPAHQEECYFSRKHYHALNI